MSDTSRDPRLLPGVSDKDAKAPGPSTIAEAWAVQEAVLRHMFGEAELKTVRAVFYGGAIVAVRIIEASRTNAMYEIAQEWRDFRASMNSGWDSR